MGMYREHIEVLSKIPEYSEHIEEPEPEPAAAEPAPYTEPAPEPVFAEPDQEPEAEAPAAAPEPEYAEPEYYEEQPAEGGQRIKHGGICHRPQGRYPGGGTRPRAGGPARRFGAV